MRGLAEYVMSGRRQAATVAVLFGLIPILMLASYAIIALVTLRKGLQEGMLVMMWALLPAGLQWLLGNTAPVFMVFGVLVLANLLRRTQSWQQVLLLATVLGVMLQLSLPLQTEYLATVEALFDRSLADSQSIVGTTEGLDIAEAKEQVMWLWTLFYGFDLVVVFTGCLMLGRFWQAMLYNPGGFRQEFHNLRVDRLMMGAVLALLIGGLAGIQPLADWFMLFTVVPGLCGLAVVHQVVAARKLGKGWLVLAYLVLLPVVVIVGFGDSWLDLRKRLAQ